jgi:membrane fusion protein (multidrug efflux system)
MSDNEKGSDHPGSAKGLAWRLRRGLLLSFGPLLVIAAGGYYYVTSARYVSTENAYVKMDKIAISADVSGHVQHVAVGENEVVETGQVLFRLDDARYRIALAQKEAESQNALQEVESMVASFRQKQAELEVTRHDVEFYQRQFERAEDLQKKGHTSQAKLDEARRDWLMSRQKVEALRQEMAGALAKLGGDPDRPARHHSHVLETFAARDESALDLNRTTIVAPQSGIVSNIQLQIGEYVEAGTPVFSIVVREPVWVESNLKETDLTHVRVGQNARVFIDAYPDHAWKAKVTGIGAATGAEFSVLPPQNASGNWVKVVQRLPVRLTLERRPDDPPLRAGMSAEVEIDTEVERSLPSFVESALAWATGER